ncbi:hypothetical protein OCK74_25750 [Chitinophagaceae bacterium LB-8]|uniref:Uncharacterized protein n=1 Tax=Paraflavisolibacter caeni TaxID=2982496 RepID=A0A9X3BHL8_9BACT|nr:hypothetical protein [Paraflavisolibacter caeni]MCU7552549.1 hypothetical protein [Paraflavisolibacter caeni]
MCKDKQGSGELDKQDFDAASSHHSQFALKIPVARPKIDTDYLPS